MSPPVCFDDINFFHTVLRSSDLFSLSQKKASLAYADLEDAFSLFSDFEQADPLGAVPRSEDRGGIANGCRGGPR